MPWFNVDDGFAFHRKTVRAGNAALGLWTRAGAWCAQHLSDGFLPKEMVGVLGSSTQARKLVEVGLWSKVDGGYQFHEWVGWQRSRSEVLAERAYNARKAALYRDPELLAAVRKRDGDRCRYCGSLVNWKDRRGSTGATYDHVDPDGPNTLDNLVIACRGCNSRKAGRTPSAAGITLLTPKRMGNSGDPAGREPVEPERTSSDPGVDQDEPGTFQVPIPSNPIQPLGIKRTRRNKPGDYLPEFELWWSTYPKRKGTKGSKFEAAKSWDKARGLVSAEVLLAAVKRYLDSQQVRDGYAKDAVTWLNQCCWEEYDEPAAEDPTEWLKAEWQAGRVRLVEERTGLHYAQPDLPAGLTEKSAIENWLRNAARQWIADNRDQILTRLTDRRTA